MNIIILDTETTSLDKPFCYDISWCIANTEDQNILASSANIVEQVWHNLPLFESAYYKEKRPKYVTMMRQHKAIMNKWGYIMRNLKQDIKNYDVQAIYAYNSDFDDKVINFNCDWFKCINPLDNIPVYDIWGYASEFITYKEDYKNFCNTYERYTDTGNYKGSAEIVYQYLTADPDFIEAHMGLYDAEIETAILFSCVELGAEYNKEYKVNKILPRIVSHPFTISIDGDKVLTGTYIKKYVRNDVYNFKSK